MYRVFAVSLISVSLLAGAGKQTTLAPNAVEVRVSNATAVPGGVVQMQFSLTEPKPIMSTGGSFQIDGYLANGIAVWSATGEACGVGAIVNGLLTFRGMDPSANLGLNTDYPFLTLTLGVPATALPGTVRSFTWSPDAFVSNLDKPYALTVKPGSIAIAGTAAISGIYPGGGTWPAGSVIRIRGSGFSSSTKLITSVKFSSISIQPNEIQIVLKSQTTIDSQQFTVQNPDRSTATYFAYLRGAWLHTPSRVLLQNAEYAFPLATHAIAGVNGVQFAEGQFQALALQNPNPGPVAVTFAVNSGTGQRASTVVLPSGTRLVDTLDALLGSPVLAGETLTVNSTAMIQIMGVAGDDTAQTLTPFLVKF